jgi:hypothetical protein
MNTFILYHSDQFNFIYIDILLKIISIMCTIRRIAVNILGRQRITCNF